MHTRVHGKGALILILLRGKLEEILKREKVWIIYFKTEEHPGSGVDKQ